MFTLIFKDLLIEKKIIALSTIYVFFMVFAYQGVQEGMFSAIVVALSYLLVQTACAYDEKNKTDIMLNSLPVKRFHIVLARYFSAFVALIIGTIEYSIIKIIIEALMIPINVYPISLSEFLGGFTALALLSSIYFPFYFKIGYIKAKMLNMILFLLVFFGIGGLSYILKAGYPIPFIESLTELQFSILLSAAVFIIMILSFLLSLHFYNKRDF